MSVDHLAAIGSLLRDCDEALLDKDMDTLHKAAGEIQLLALAHGAKGPSVTVDEFCSAVEERRMPQAEDASEEARR